MNTLVRFTAAVTIAGCSAVAAVLACGPHYAHIITVRRVVPHRVDAYARGELGIVRPTFERTFLVQAYRQLSGLPPVAALTKPTRELTDQRGDGYGMWNAVPGAIHTYPYYFDKTTYSYFLNCADDALATAARTYAARKQKYGTESRELREWLAAQNAVFSNCQGATMAYPDPAPPGADVLTRTDREYQIAAAYFYQMKFDEAAKRFTAIASNSESPWRSYGRYLAARASIRNATLFDRGHERKRQMLEAAAAELRNVLGDDTAVHLHASVSGLLQFVDGQMRPYQRLHELSAALANDRELSAREIVDFRTLMNRIVGDTVEYPYDAARGGDLIANDPMVDWIVAMQGMGGQAVARTVEQWKSTGSIPWLVAALWRIPPAHADAPAVLAAAAKVERGSPGFATVSFLRTRLLAARGERREARALLATLPAKVSPGFPPEALNLLNGMRFALADNLEELLTAAARHPVSDSPLYSDRIALDKPVFDEDAGDVFTYYLPLTRLVAAAQSRVLPDRLRLRVATAAFSRAIVLGRHDEALALAPLLTSLAPALTEDMQRFTRAADRESRHIAAVRLLLRTPGMHATVRGRENEVQYARVEPKRRFEHRDSSNWWCTLQNERTPAAYALSTHNELIYGNDPVPPPVFLTPAEGAQVRLELETIREVGPATTWLGKEAIKWAKARPKDLDAAEALAHAVEGARWGCWQDSDPNTSRRAFQTLHRLFPKSEWARRTRYWY